MNDYQMGVIESRFADLIWENEPISSAELSRRSEELFKWKKSTTYTVLKRLCDKGIFQNNKGTVTSVISKQEFYSVQSEKFVAETFSGSLPAFLTAFTARKDLTSEEVAYLREMVAKYEDGSFSYVQTADGAPTYTLTKQMELVKMIDDNTSQVIGTLEEAGLSKENFESRFRMPDLWSGVDTIQSVKDKNKHMWQVQTNSDSELTHTYILLEQKDGTFYLGEGYLDSEGTEQENVADSYIRWFYQLEVTADYVTILGGVKMGFTELELRHGERLLMQGAANKWQTVGSKGGKKLADKRNKDDKKDDVTNG